MNEKEKLEAALQTILARAKNVEGARHILALLFPSAEEVLKTYLSSDYSSPKVRKRERKISDRDSALNYFRLDPLQGNLSKSEIKSLVGADDPILALGTALGRIGDAPKPDQSRLRYSLLDLLDGAFGPTRPFTEEWFRAIVEYSPYFLSERDAITPVLFEIDNASRIRWLLIHGLQSVETGPRIVMFINVTRGAADISVLCDLARTVIGDLHPVADNAPIEPFFGSAEADLHARAELLDRVRKLAKTGALWSQAEPRLIIWFWWGSNEVEEVRTFTESAMRTKKGLRKLLDLTVNVVKSSEGDYERIQRTSIAHIVDVDELERRARFILKRKAANASDKSLAHRFLAALQRGSSNTF